MIAINSPFGSPLFRVATRKFKMLCCSDASTGPCTCRYQSSHLPGRARQVRGGEEGQSCSLRRPAEPGVSCSQLQGCATRGCSAPRSLSDLPWVTGGSEGCFRKCPLAPSTSTTCQALCEDSHPTGPVSAQSPEHTLFQKRSRVAREAWGASNFETI